MNAVLIQNVTLDEIERMIGQAVEKRMEEFYQRISPKEPIYIKRKEAARLIGVSLPTLDAYARAGFIKPKRVGGRVYYEKGQLVNCRRAFDEHLPVSE